MFDSTSCPRQLTSSFAINFEQFQSLNKLLLLVVILAVFGLVWVIKNRGWRRRLTQPRAILWLVGFIATLALMFVVVVFQGLFLPTDSAKVADAIVILGRGEPFRIQRVDVAAELWRFKRSSVIFVSGRGDAAQIIHLLKEKGIANQVLDGENCSLTTKENAIFTAAILKPQATRIVLITDAPHMWRSLLLFQDLGFQVTPHKSGLPNSLSFQQRIFLALKESSLLVDYLSLKRFHQPDSPKFTNPTFANLVQKAEQYGYHLTR